MKLTSLITLILAVLLLTNCTKEQNAFTKSEIELLKKLNFSQKAISILKKDITSEFYQYETSDPGYSYQDGKKVKSGIKKQNGISFTFASNINVNGIITKFKADLEKLGYQFFKSEMGFREEPTVVSIIKSNDQYEILRLEATDGANYDLTNEEIIKKFKVWDKKYDLKIYGADYDWTDVWFSNPPKNVKGLAKEIYKFCPDIVDQGVGSVEELEKMISEGVILTFWWD